MNLPPYKSFPELSSERIRLREVRPEDIPNLLEILTYDGKPAETLTGGTHIVNQIHQNYLDGNSVNWVIENPETHELMGFVGYYRGFGNGIGEIGFILKAAFRGLGFMSPALVLATEFGLNEMKLKGVTAFTKPDNEKAIAVLSRNGFRAEKKPEGKYLKFVYVKVL
ncbi:GNAT family N-acetyltransferase [Fluviicola sp.]|uniref:GNAT family N-acetyltransferase n=1 Tax=Fluviicola sp. TaxID=1917219 RepID=UPI0031D1157A